MSSLSFDQRYQEACEFAMEGRHAEAKHLLEELAKLPCDRRQRGLIMNDRGALAMVNHEWKEAESAFEAALEEDDLLPVARANLDYLQVVRRRLNERLGISFDGNDSDAERRCRVAIVSFLFNWPSTGGGIVHTIDLARFLQKDGYDVRHFYAEIPAAQIGVVDEPLPFASKAICFPGESLSQAHVVEKYQQAVDDYSPDFVIVTDSWNIKPILAHALKKHRVIWRFQALECLCPLNNARLLLTDQGAHQCQKNQCATPGECRKCIKKNAGQSGWLHQWERDLAGVGDDHYEQILFQSLHEAEAVFVVNPKMKTMLEPYADVVEVVPSGFDPERFQARTQDGQATVHVAKKKSILFAGLTHEFMKGFYLLREAGSLLWKTRQDFEIVVTGDSVDGAEEFLRFVGWKEQKELPKLMQACDMVVTPAVHQEALGRTAVEGMGAGRPVITSRLGGLEWVVVDGVTGLHFEPGNAEDLAKKIARLLDDPALGQQLGQEGQKRFHDHFTWDAILPAYRKILGPAVTRQSAAKKPA